MYGLTLYVNGEISNPVDIKQNTQLTMGWNTLQITITFYL